MNMGAQLLQTARLMADAGGRPPGKVCISAVEGIRDINPTRTT